MKKDIKIGGHLPITNGLRYLPINVKALNYQCAQISLNYNDSYEIHPFDDTAVREFQLRTREIDIFVKFPPTLDLCDNLPRRKAFNMTVFRRHFQESARLGAKAVIVNACFERSLSFDLMEKHLIEFLREVKQEGPLIYISTTPGLIVYSRSGLFTSLVKVVKELDYEIKICIDTAYLYIMGENLWNDENRNSFLSKYGHLIDLVYLNVPNVGINGGYRDSSSIAFINFKLNSDNMVYDLLQRYPIILERTSLHVQNMDQLYLRSVLKEKAEKL